jgi:hypothetical protein
MYLVNAFEPPARWGNSRVPFLLVPRRGTQLGYRPASRRELVFEHGERGAPPICDMLKRYLLGKAMPCSVPLRNRVPGTVLDRYACFIANTLKAYFYLR